MLLNRSNNIPVLRDFRFREIKRVEHLILCDMPFCEFLFDVVI